MGKFWFRAKKTGWGISYPISWEGWGIAILFLICLIIEICLTNKNTMNGKIQLVLEILATSFIFLFAVRNKVEGGLKWRSGDDD